MSTLAIVLIVAGAVVLLVLLGGFAATRRRERLRGGAYAGHVAAADRALQEARAADKGWDRPMLEDAARRAVAAARPGWTVEELHLVLVDDRPGVTEDRAQFVAMGGGEEVRVVLTRHDAGWAAERVE
jgi:hypothetical protein